MRRAVFALGAVLVVAVIAIVAMPRRAADSTFDAPAAGGTVGSTPPVEADATGVAGEPADGDDTAHPVAPASARPAEVTALADGDSFRIVWLDTDEPDELRLIGINAPELDACFGEQAQGVLERMIGDATLAVDLVGRDDFGRELANVWADGVFVNAELVAVGAAVALSDSGEHGTLLTEQEAAAMRGGVGMWDPSECGTVGSSAVRIVSLVADAPGRDDLNPNGEWIDIGNDGAAPAALDGWSVRDESTRHRYHFPAGFALAPGATVRVHSGCGDDTPTELFWCDGDPVWNNGGDTAYLLDADGHFVDTLTYGG